MKEHLIRNSVRIKSWNQMREEILEITRTQQYIESQPMPTQLGANPKSKSKDKDKSKSKGTSKGKNVKGHRISFRPLHCWFGLVCKTYMEANSPLMRGKCIMSCHTRTSWFVIHFHDTSGTVFTRDTFFNTIHLSRRITPLPPPNVRLQKIIPGRTDIQANSAGSKRTLS